MRFSKGWFGFGLAVSAVALTLVCAPAYAAGTLHGRVLQVNGPGTVLVRHDAYDGMPAMTMTFHVAGNQHLAAGDEITATVDRSKEPWEL
jgi:Cu/Ag efflux protein CusF